MRHSRQIALAIVTLLSSASVAGARPLSATDLALVNRVSWGLSAQELQEVEAKGTDRWLREQLHPKTGDHLPPEVLARIGALPALSNPLQQQMQEIAVRVQAAKATLATAAAAPPIVLQAALPQGVLATPAAGAPPIPLPTANQVRQTYLNDAFGQAQARSVLRDLYSTDQLREQMTWFWFNHFNVQGEKADTKLFIGDYEDQALRPHALGRFRDLLEATLRSPAMLQYLDNAQNAANHINENYAREIMELHTMGVGTGYTQRDVQELARVLTGVGVAPANGDIKVPPAKQALVLRDGMFLFNPNRHDFGDKIFMGYAIKGSGFAEVEQALDIIAGNPATAQHVSRQLAQYFVADAPPPSLIATMTKRWSATGGDIAAVLDTMFHSREFRASLAAPLLKDPQHYVLSAIRAIYGEQPIRNVRPVLGWLNQLAEPLYGHSTPDGYALERAAWNGPGQIEQRFEIARNIGGGVPALFKDDAAPLPAPPTPDFKATALSAALAPTLSPETQTALAQAQNAREWNMLYLSSPDFMRR